MSTVLTDSRSRRTPARAAACARRASGDAALGLTLAVALGIVAFVTGGGTDLGPNTWVEITVMVVGAGLAIAALLLSAPARASGTGTLLLFVALAAFTAASIAWSVQPADSWIEANRTVSYLAAFAGSMALTRIVPSRWAALIGAVAVLATVISGYALVVKVFPASLDPGDVIGRLRLPFDYWNAVGLLAAMGVPACIWAGARREGGLLSDALAVPALGILVVTIMLSLSRGALVVVVLGLVVWFALVPLRLRAAVTLILGVLGGAAVTTWGLTTPSLINDHVTQHARTIAGHQFGVVLVVMLILQMAAGVAASVAGNRIVITERTRRRAGITLVVLASLLPIAGIGAVAASSRGLTGTVSHAWTQLTSPSSAGAGDVPGRLLELGSTRGRYWNEGLKVAEHALLKGSGAGGFATARTHYTATSIYASVQHAHSYVIETFADLGLIGLTLSGALLIAWSLAAQRAVGGWARPAEARAAERSGLLTLLVIVIIYGLDSAIDWTWFVPGTTLTALVCAGWLAGRGPLAEPVGRGHKRKLMRLGLSAVGASTVIVAVTLLAAWLIFQPLRSANADLAALTAITKGNTSTAIADAHAAATDDPVSVDPLFELAAFYRASGHDPAALAELQKAVSLQPSNPQTWFQKGQFLMTLNRPGQALPTLMRAAQLDLGGAQIDTAVERVAAELKAPRPTPDRPGPGAAVLGPALRRPPSATARTGR